MSADALHSALSRVASSAAAGLIAPLPLAAHDINCVAMALRQMSQARHVGKIVVRAPTRARAIKPASTVIVTGGLGGLGVLVTRWLAQQSASSVHLLGRSGLAAASEAAQLVTSSHSTVIISKSDVSMRADLEAAVGATAQQQRSAPPLQGVLHAAGVLADATVAKQTIAGLRAVFAPKVLPVDGWSHAIATQPAPLQLFFSSVAALLGAPAQMNYSAANGLLDAAARAAQASGQPSASVQWGAWASGGMASCETAVRVERMGMGMIEPAAGLAALQGLLSSSAMPALVGANPFAWHRFMARLQQPYSGSLFAAFAHHLAYGKPADSAVAAPVVATATKDLASAASAAAGITTEGVAAQVAAAVAAVLGCTVAPGASLMEAGLDSLGSGGSNCWLCSCCCY